MHYVMHKFIEMLLLLINKSSQQVSPQTKEVINFPLSILIKSHQGIIIHHYYSFVWNVKCQRSMVKHLRSIRMP